MIHFSCPVCSLAFKVADEKGGLRTKCPKCKEPLVVPAPPALDEDSPPVPDASGAMRPIRWAAVAGLLICCFVGVGLWSLSQKPDRQQTDVAVRPKAETDETETRKRAEREASEHRAETERLQAEITRQRAELASQREEQTRREATEVADQALKTLQRQVTALEGLDRLYREVVDNGDQKAMNELVGYGLKPEDELVMLKPDSAFSKARKKFIEDHTAELREKLSGIEKSVTATLSTLANPKFPQDVRAGFQSAAAKAVGGAEALLKKPYPDPSVAYKDALAAAKPAREALRKEKVEKSKLAATAIQKYFESLPNSSDTRLSQLNVLPALGVLVKMQTLHRAGKLTAETARTELRGFPSLGRGKSYRELCRALIKYAGDLRIENDPECPSIAETYAVASVLLNADIGELFDGVK